MGYVLSGSIGSSVNGFAAFLSGAASYFIPLSTKGVVAEPMFVNELNSTGKLDVFLETCGSITLNIKHLALLDKKCLEVSEFLIDKGLIRVESLTQEGEELFEMLRSRLNDKEALIVAQSIESHAERVVVESKASQEIVVALGKKPLSQKKFLLEAYRHGLVSPKELLKFF